MWQWYNFVERSVPPTRQVLRINLDETAVCLHPDTDKGNVFITTRPVYRVQRWKTRTYFTHVAIVCDNMELQPHMPQLIIGNERTQSNCPSKPSLTGNWPFTETTPANDFGF